VRVSATCRRESGFTLIEVVVAMTIIVVGALGTLMLVDRANSSTSKTRTRQTATGLMRDLLETAQGLPYTSVAPDTIAATLQGKGFGDDVAGTAGWQVIRGGTTFTVTASVCTVDDASGDGSGVHPAGSTYCSDSAAGTGDPNPDDYKRVTVTITAPASLSVPAVTQTTVVGANRVSNVASAGSSAQNPVTGLVITSPTTLYNGQIAPCSNATLCTFPAATTASVAPKSISFQATTASSAPKFRFYVDGQAMTTLSGPGQTFNWTWNLPDGQPDGVYTVAAQAYDSTVSVAQGEPKLLTITINRYKPDGTAYAVPLAGRNPLFSSVPEVETYPSSSGTARVDRDVTGFNFWVYQGNSSSGTMWCTTSAVDKRWCADTLAPNNNSQRQYAIAPVGLNPDGSALEGTISGKSADINVSNTRPNPPTGVGVTRNGTIATINWTVPSGSGDPDSGDCVLFFRVYSKPSGDASSWVYDNRVGRTAFGNPVAPCGDDATETSTDIILSEANGSAKQYRVTAVDRHMAESTMVTVSG
jgi:prepilin-type N-terminal cleavage/methylation domain-containing protein